MTDLKYALKCAREFGSEARANGRDYMTLDDRLDIAHYYGAKWEQISDEHQEKLKETFVAGARSEARLTKHLAHGGGILDNVDECEVCNG